MFSSFLLAYVFDGEGRASCAFLPPELTGDVSVLLSS